MTNFHASYLAGQWLQICRAASCASGPGEYVYMYIYMCVYSDVCEPEHAFVYAGDR